MSSRLSSLLVQDGLVPAKRITDAFQRQVIQGGTLDSNLIEMKALDEDELLSYLGRAAGLPTQPRGIHATTSPREDVLEVFTKDVAERFHAVPTQLLPGGVLQVLVPDGVDLGEMDTLALTVQQRIEPWIVLESRFVEAMDKVYGTGVAGRYTRLIQRSDKAHEAKGWPAPRLIDPLPRFGSLATLRLNPAPPTPPAPAVVEKPAEPVVQVPVVQVVPLVQDAPAVVQVAPAVVQVAPAVVQVAPAAVEPVPAAAQVAPIEEPKAVEEPKPVVEQPKAVVEAPKPVVEQPKAVVEAPRPVVEAPKAVVEEPKAVVEAPKVPVEEPQAPVSDPKVGADEPTTPMEIPPVVQAVPEALLIEQRLGEPIPEVAPTVVVDPRMFGIEKSGPAIVSPTAANRRDTPSRVPVVETSGISADGIDSLSMEDWLSAADWLTGPVPSSRSPKPAVAPTEQAPAEKPATAPVPVEPVAAKVAPEPPVVAPPPVAVVPSAMSPAGRRKRGRGKESAPQAKAAAPAKPAVAQPNKPVAQPATKPTAPAVQATNVKPAQPVKPEQPVAAKPVPAQKPVQLAQPTQPVQQGKPQPVQQGKPQPVQQGKPQPTRPESKPEIKPESRPEIRPESRPEIRPESRPEVRPTATPTVSAQLPVQAQAASGLSEPPRPSEPRPVEPGPVEPRPAVVAAAPPESARTPETGPPLFEEPISAPPVPEPVPEPINSGRLGERIIEEPGKAAAQAPAVAQPPAKAAEPAKVEQAAKVEQPAAKQAAKVEQPAAKQPAKVEPAAKPAKIEQAAKPAKVEPPTKVEPTAKIEVPAKVEQAAKVEQTVKIAVPAKVEQTAKIEVPAQADQDLPPPSAESPVPVLRSRPRVAQALSEPGSSPLSLEAAREIVAEAGDRDVVFEALCRGLRSRVAFAAVLTVHGDVAFGRLALHETWAERDKLGRISVNLDRGSPFRQAIRGRGPVVGKIGEQGASSDPLRAFGRKPPLPGAVLPLLVRGKPVALIYIDDDGLELASDLLDELRPVLAEAGQALQRLSLKGKTGGLAPGAEGEKVQAEQPEVGTSGYRAPSLKSPPKAPEKIGDKTADKAAEKTSPVPQPLSEQPTTPMRTGTASAGADKGKKPEAGSTDSPTPLPVPMPLDVTAPMAFKQPAEKPAQVQVSVAGKPVAEPAPAVKAPASGWAAIVESAAKGDGEALNKLLRGGADAAAAVVAALPGPLRKDARHALGDPVGGPVFSQGPLLGLVLRMGAAPIAPMLERLKDPATPVDARYFIAMCFAETPVLAAVAPLGERLFDKDESVRTAAVTALRSFPPSAELLALISHLRDEVDGGDTTRVRLAVEALGELRVVASVPQLINRLDADDPALLDALGRALQNITKQDFGRSRVRWTAWWRRHEEQPRLQWLLDGLANPSAMLRSAAQEELAALCGDVVGYRFDQPKRERDLMRRRWAEWWQRRGFPVA